MRRWVKVLGIIVVAVLLLALATGLWVRSLITGSLPQLEGEVRVAGLSAASPSNATLSVCPPSAAPTVSMSLAALDSSTPRSASSRWTSCDARAPVSSPNSSARPPSRPIGRPESTDSAPSHGGSWKTCRLEHKRIQQAYTEGVNAGLAALDQPPFEYQLLRLEPEPWLDEDTTLVLYAMYFELNDEIGNRESARGLLADLIDPELAAFLVPAGTSWDAALDGGTMPVPPMPAALPDRLRDAGCCRRRIPHRRRFLGIDGRQQQLGGGRIADRGRQGHPRRRHAPGAEPAQHLVPGLHGMAR